MDVLVSLVEIVFGVLIIGVALASAFRTFVLSRASFNRVTGSVFLGLRSFLVWVTRHVGRLDREAVLSLHAPIGLLVMALAWAAGIIVGFALLFHATAPIGLDEAFVLAGSSFTTLGFEAPARGIQQFLAIAAAVLGLGIVALLISYLPTIYGLYSRREVTVADVAIKSGGVAHGPDLVRNLSRGYDTVRIDSLWTEWGHWLIALGETHTSEPALSFFRSPRGERSWLATATTLLDAALLRNHVLAKPTSVRGDLAYRAGVEAITSIAHFFFVRPCEEDEPECRTRLRREEFDAAVRQLAEAEIPVVDDLDAAWEAFSAGRAEWEPHVLGLAELVTPPPAPWMTELLERD
jgi:hypothetical protein